MPWEIFTKKRGKALTGELIVSLSPPGRIGISLQVFEKFFKDKPFVVLAFDPEKKRIGLRPVEKADGTAYPISMGQKRKTGAYVAAIAFFKFYGIVPNTRVRKTVKEEDGWLVIDLD